MNSVPVSRRQPAGTQAELEWQDIAAHRPELAAAMGRYLTQASTFLAPRSIEVADNTLRQLARFLIADTSTTLIAGITRNDIEAFKVWLAAQPGGRPGTTLSSNTQRQRLGMLRVFFERIIEWDWDDAPRRNPVIGRDLPPRPDPLPKFLDDRDAAKLMAAARASTDPRDRLIVELLARTGMRAGEACELAADAVVLIGDSHWLRVPLGKLRNDRYVPLHPDLVALLVRWTADNLDHIRRERRLIADHRGPIDRHVLDRIVRRIGRHAGISVHPHQLRHTLATQAINRGMRLEAIAALLGHRTMHMTLTYARIADRVVADQYNKSTPPSTPSTTSRHDSPPTTRQSAWSNSVAKHTPACSATDSATDPSSWTAALNQPAKPAATSPPALSSCPSYSSNATTPAITTKPTAPSSSTTSSTKPKHALDIDHPYNGAYACAAHIRRL
ncbi:MAG TPA: site-specific integrase [Ilumatobacter sp.]